MFKVCTNDIAKILRWTDYGQEVQSRFVETLTLNPNFGESGFGESGRYRTRSRSRRKEKQERQQRSTQVCVKLVPVQIRVILHSYQYVINV